MESIVSLERGVCLCVELQVFSCYRGWKESCQVMREISTTWRWELSSSSFSLQGKVLKEIHTILKATLGDYAPSKTGWATVNVVIFHLCCTSYWTIQNSDNPEDYWPNSWPNLGRPVDFNKINSWATGHLTWAGWVHHSWRFGHAEALRKVGPKIPECGSKMSMVPVIWATFGIFWRDPNGFLSRLLTRDET